MSTYFSAYARHARRKSAVLICRFFGPSSRSTLSSIGQAVAVPARHVRRVEAQHVAGLDDEVLEDLVERRADVDLAVGVRRPVVQQVELGALPRRRIWPYRSIASHRAMASGSAVCRLAFIEKAVRGRLQVSFHSGMAVTAYCNGTVPRDRIEGHGGPAEGGRQKATDRCRHGPRSRPRQRPEGAGAGSAYRAARLGMVLVQGGLAATRARA